MARVQIYGESVQGASHSRIGKVCQDSCKIDCFDQKIYVASVADGHGSEDCPFSDEGSFCATKIFCRLMIDYYRTYKDEVALLRFLQAEGEIKIAKTIDYEWKKMIEGIHKQKKRDLTIDEDDVYKLYGTTLLGIAITDLFVYAFKIGDGNITYIDKNEAFSVIQDEKILGVETHSLSKRDSWRRAYTKLLIRKQDIDLPYMYMLTTDGFANSFVSENEFYKNCKGYFDMIEIHGFKPVKDNLEAWLRETSDQGCGDDITAVLAFFS